MFMVSNETIDPIITEIITTVSYVYAPLLNGLLGSVICT